mmetsp:Transcript_30646/g.50794  ORF Transcript_30646/g.50794 Transcript_30646/m.50794 type:complete len:421 (-) Transcript_30646:663-1925(-)
MLRTHHGLGSLVIFWGILGALVQFGHGFKPFPAPHANGAASNSVGMKKFTSQGFLDNNSNTFSRESVNIRRDELYFGGDEAVVAPQVKEYDIIMGNKIDSRTLIVYVNGVLIASLLAFTIFNLVTANADYARGWTWDEYLMRMPGDNLMRYETSASAHPILTKALTSMTAYGVGDFTTQVLQGRTLETVDLRRSSRSAFAGFIGHGPLCHFWIEWMEANLSFDDAWWNFIPKVIADQTGWSLYLNAMYVLITKGLQLKPPGEIIKDIKTTCVPALMAGWRFWPFVHCISFSSLLPVTFKLLFIDVMEVIWVTILARVTQDTNFDEKGKPEGAAESGAAPPTTNPLAVIGEINSLIGETQAPPGGAAAAARAAAAAAAAGPPSAEVAAVVDSLESGLDPGRPFEAEPFRAEDLAEARSEQV